MGDARLNSRKDSGVSTLTSVKGDRIAYNPNIPFYGKCRDVDEFQKLNRVGEGTYGIVYRVKDTRSGKVVALKKVRMEEETDGLPISSLREISILKRMNHPNIVNVTGVAVGPKPDAIFLVMEYCEQDMGTLLDTVKTPYKPSEVKCLMKQLLKGLEYCHNHAIIHRDLKMSNLLLTWKGELKIADFGLARTLSRSEPMTPRVVTLWYRAPELLFGQKLYSTAVDMWSAGCIMGELLQHRPLFPGHTEQAQIEHIVKLLGTPTEKIWPGLQSLPRFQSAEKLVLPNQGYNNIKNVFPGCSENTWGFLNELLKYNPANRLTVRRALRHDYFLEPPRPQDPSLLPTHPEIRNHASLPVHIAVPRAAPMKDDERKRRLLHAEGADGNRGIFASHYKRLK